MIISRKNKRIATSPDKLTPVFQKTKQLFPSETAPLAAPGLNSDYLTGSQDLAWTANVSDPKQRFSELWPPHQNSDRLKDLSGTIRNNLQILG